MAHWIEDKDTDDMDDYGCPVCEHQLSWNYAEETGKEMPLDQVYAFLEDKTSLTRDDLEVDKAYGVACPKCGKHFLVARVFGMVEPVPLDEDEFAYITLSLIPRKRQEH